MITTGKFSHHKFKTEIIDVINGQTCSYLNDFPSEYHGAMGANIQGTPIVCGGWGSKVEGSGQSDSCYKFTKTNSPLPMYRYKWKNFTRMKDRREKAAGIVYKNKFHLFGGFNGGVDNGTILNSSEIISKDGVVIDGPDLPTAIYSHSITAINETVSILSGGSKDVWPYWPYLGIFVQNCKI